MVGGLLLIDDIYRRAARAARISGGRNVAVLCINDRLFGTYSKAGRIADQHVVIASREGEMFVRHNGQRMNANDLTQHVSGIISGLFSLGGRPDQALVQQRVVHHSDFDQISYQGTADARIIVYREVPLMAMLRLPTRASGGRANLHQGAIGAGVDLETGRTIHAVVGHRTIARHPDTRARLIGFKVPCWQQILEMATRVGKAVELGYVGVDVVIDSQQGPMVLEANARPGLAIQIANQAGLLPGMERIDRELNGNPN